MIKKLISILIGMTGFVPAFCQSTIPTSYQGAVVYDFQSKVAGTGVAYKIHEFTHLLGTKYSLELTGFAGMTNHNLPMAALTAGKTFKLADALNGYLGVGGDQVQSFPRPHVCVQAGVNWSFQG